MPFRGTDCLAGNASSLVWLKLLKVCEIGSCDRICTCTEPGLSRMPLLLGYAAKSNYELRILNFDEQTTPQCMKPNS